MPLIDNLHVIVYYFTVSSHYMVGKRQWNSKSIRALRQHLGFTQQEMADRLGTRQQTISEWEKGMYQPRGASSTLLHIVAEQADFEYSVTPVNDMEEKQ